MNKTEYRRHTSWRREMALALALIVSVAAPNARSASGQDDDPHAKVFSDDAYPSAEVCGNCHQTIFWEWAASNHAYSSISPMFHKFEQTINNLSSGTIGSFCVRCHQQVGTQRGEPREQPLWERSEISREGVTCITCHRVNKEFGKVNGQRHVQPGTIYEPVYGAGVEENLDEVIQDSEYYNLATTKEEGEESAKGTPIHLETIEFDQIEKSEFCVSCHQVAVHPGIKLEVVWDQYRDSPALKHGITCQECHMGKVPGKAMGYSKAPIAIVNGRVIGEDKKHSNHSFYGPGYPIAHPGLFPYNPRARNWEIEEWLQFNYRAPWGDPEWEAKLAAGEVEAVDFPEPWKDRRDRELARYIITQNQALLEKKRSLRKQVMENGTRIDGPFFDSTPRAGEDLDFHYRVTNIDDGHNLPSGSLGAQPEIWLNVVLTGPDGERVWESGYVDDNGDMADLHSLEVAAGNIEHDDQLFNLQTKFLTTNVKGTDREMYLPVNFDIDQIPFIRPSGVPTSVLNHPPFIRMEARSIPPLGYRDAEYTVDGSLLSKPGTYRLQVRLRSRAEPIYFMKFVGATVDMERAMNEWMLDIHPYAVEFEVQ
jgi:nitrate/TMAO reductase-like tetraheme cytochrome c subunit